MNDLLTARQRLTQRLQPVSETPELDAQVLLAWLLGKTRSWVAAHSEHKLDASLEAQLENVLQRCERGEPLPYILGRWEFYRLPFVVTPDVLIPRPETELLVDRAIAWFRNRLLEPSETFLLDVGTGSGCIAIALAVNLPSVRVVATDISPAALSIASRNAHELGVQERITFLEADLFPPDGWKGSASLALPATYAIITANLPYIPTCVLKELPVYLKEPTPALDGGQDGINLIRRFLLKAPHVLAPGGLLLMEIEASAGAAVLALAYDAFSNAEIHLHQDLAGKDRLLEVINLP